MTISIPEKNPVPREIEAIFQAVIIIAQLMEMPEENKELIRKIRATIMEIKAAMRRE